MSTLFSDDETFALVAIVHEFAKREGEDVIGVILKTLGHMVLDGKGVVALAEKLQARRSLIDPVMKIREAVRRLDAREDDSLSSSSLEDFDTCSKDPCPTCGLKGEVCLCVVKSRIADLEDEVKTEIETVHDVLLEGFGCEAAENPDLGILAETVSTMYRDEKRAREAAEAREATLREALEKIHTELHARGASRSPATSSANPGDARKRPNYGKLKGNQVKSPSGTFEKHPSHKRFDRG